MERQDPKLGVISANRELIETYVSLVMCRGLGNDWFYKSVPREDIKKILHLVEEEDIRQDIFVFILNSFSNYRGTNFSSYLKLSLGLFVRDKVLSYINQYTRVLDLQSRDTT